MKIPALVRSRKSSMKRSSQYCGGRPRGNTGCCSFLDWKTVVIEWILVIFGLWNFSDTLCFEIIFFFFWKYLNTRPPYKWLRFFIHTGACTHHFNNSTHYTISERGNVQNWTNHRTAGLISEDRSNKGYSASYNTRFPFKSSASDLLEVRSKLLGLSSPYCSTLACIHACPRPPCSRI